MTPTLPSLVLVEDDENNSFTLRALLEDEGFRTVVAGSCAEARVVLRSATEDYCIAIVDQNLGDGDGYELVPVLRATHPRAKVILMSGTEQDPVRGEFRNKR